MSHYKLALNKRQYLDNQKSQQAQDSNHNPVMLALVDSGPEKAKDAGRRASLFGATCDGRRHTSIGDRLYDTTKSDVIQQLCCDALSRYFATSDTRHVDIYLELVRLLKRGSRR